MKHYLAVLGTRPEAIKLAPVVRAAQQKSSITIDICSTGQHQEMLTQALKSLDLEVDHNLGLMRHNQSLSMLYSDAVAGIDKLLVTENFDGVIVQGDTTTAFAGAVAAFHRQLPIVHVEAGLRTKDLANPFPEEGNRVLIDSIASICAAPTQRAAENLKKSGIPDSRIQVTGNTAIDSLLWMRDKLSKSRADGNLAIGAPGIDLSKRIITVTGHRRESFGDDFENICRAIYDVAVRYPDVEIVYPVHLNPNVQDPVYRILTGLENVHLCDPLPYQQFVQLLTRSYMALTDSGGIQEEAPSLDLPVLVMRKTTERPEGLEVGCAKLVGVSKQSITQGVTELLEDASVHRAMAESVNPYGDGHAAERILSLL